MKIYLSAGHGGQDSGAVGIDGRKEKDETLRLALEVEKLLRKAGHDVIMHRTSDKYVCVTEIASRANAANADLFVAIHLNASNGEGHGTECLVYPSCSAASRKMAKAIEGRISDLGFTSRGVKAQSTNTYVLKATKMPATTVEVCFIDNASDMSRYDNHIMDIPRRIANGILDVAGGQLAEINVTSDDDIWRWRVDEIALKSAPYEEADTLKTLMVGDEVILESYFEGDEYARVRAGGTRGYIKFDLIKR